MDMNSLARRVHELSKKYHNYVGEYSHGTATGWHILILDAIERLNDDIEDVHTRLDEITRTLENITSATYGQKSDLMREVEGRFGKSIQELLGEREGRSVREIAEELGVSKSTIANWLKEVSR